MLGAWSFILRMQERDLGRGRLHGATEVRGWREELCLVLLCISGRALNMRISSSLGFLSPDNL